MQTASAELTTALTSRERQVVLRVKVDWLRDGSWSYDPGIVSDIASDTILAAGDIGDLSRFVESASVDRSLSTDLPEAAKETTGFGAAEASVALVGDLAEGTPLARALTAHGGTVGAIRRVGSPIIVDVGAVGANGAEYLRQFTGKVRSVTIDPFTGGISLTALDGRERLRASVILPATVGQTGYYFLSYIATANAVTLLGDGTVSEGVATPTTEASDSWAMLQEIAAAELGVVLFDENDNLQFYNRNRMSGGVAVATLTVAGETFSNLKAMQASESIDSVRNRVNVTASPYVLDEPGTNLWFLSVVVGVPANGSTGIPILFDFPVYAITGVNYAAAKVADGTGGDISNLTFGYTQYSVNGWIITVSNPNAFNAFLVANSVPSPPFAQGDPLFAVVGQGIRPAEGEFVSTVTDSASVAVWGTQPLDLLANVWRQSIGDASDLAAHLLAALKEPHPTLTGVEIVGDPRLQLTDRVRVVEPDGLSLDGDFWCTAIQTRFSASDGLVQSVTLRAT